LPEDPDVERTELRHGFLRAMDGRAGGGGMSLAMDWMAGEGAFAAAVTEPFGDRLNVFGSAMLVSWDRDFGPPVL